jgi:metal-responsive CopG/Arc/MetJ family transcriptional regulator
MTRKRVQLTLSALTLEQLEKEAEKNGYSKSQFVDHLVRKYLEEKGGDKILEK